MPTVYISMWDPHDQEIMLPLPYKKVGNKYLYGPEANGPRRKPAPLKLSPWQKVADGFVGLFFAITHWTK